MSQTITGLQFGDEYPAALDYMDRCPPIFELPQVDIVHGFFEPGVPLPISARPSSSAR